MDALKPISIIVTGDFHHAEFRESFNKNRFDDSNCRAEKVEMQQLLLSDASQYQNIDAIVIAQTRRGQVSDEQVSQLWHKFPLVERVLVYGSWCEGETRSGQPVSNIRRVHIRQWPTILDNWMSVAAGQSGSMRGQLASFNRADELMSAADDEIGELPPLQVLVSSVGPNFCGTIQSFGEPYGWQVARLAVSPMEIADPSLGKADLLVCDCYYSIDEAVSLLEGDSEYRSLPVVVVMGFPRLQDQQALDAIGIQYALLRKPFGNEALQHSIRNLLRSRKLSVVSEVA